MPRPRLPPGASHAQYEVLSTQADSEGETNDCAVRAVAAATGIDYKSMLAAFYSQGRKVRGRTQQEITFAVIQQFGFKYVRLDLSDFNPPARAARGKHGITSHHPDRFPQMWKGKGPFLCFSSGHVWAVVNGTTIDWSRGKSIRVRQIYRLERV